MAFDLILRRQNSRFVPAWDHDKFWTVVCQGEVVGSIIQETLAGADTAWTWSIHLHAGRHGNGLCGLSGRADMLDAAMAEFRNAFDRAIAHIGADGWAHHVAHMAELAARSGTKPSSPG